MMFQRRHPVEMAPAELAAVYLAADVVTQEIEGDKGYYRRLMCHTAYLREDRPEVYEAIVLLLTQVREARACAVDAAA